MTLSVELEDEVHKELRAIAKREGILLTRLVRDILKGWLHDIESGKETIVKEVTNVQS